MSFENTEAGSAKGEVGVDGMPIEEEKDVAVLEENKALEALARNRAYLGREFLTWLLYRSNSGDPISRFEDHNIVVVVVGKVVLQGLAGEATELAVKGHLSAYSDVVKSALARGLLLHSARLRMQHGEQVFEVTVDAEQFDFKSASIPALLGKNDEDKLQERLWLADKLSDLFDTLWHSFLEKRNSSAWKPEIVPAMKAWFEETDD